MTVRIVFVYMSIRMMHRQSGRIIASGYLYERTEAVGKYPAHLFGFLKSQYPLYPRRNVSAPATAPAPMTTPADRPVTVPWVAASSRTPTVAPPAPPTPAPTPVTAASSRISFSSAIGTLRP